MGRGRILVAALLAFWATGARAEDLVTLQTRPGVTQPFYVNPAERAGEAGAAL